MTFDNGPQGPPQSGPPQGQQQWGPPQAVPPPPAKPTGNKRHAKLYIGLGVGFVLLALLNMMGDGYGVFRWIFGALGLTYIVLGIRATRTADTTIDPFTRGATRPFDERRQP